MVVVDCFDIFILVRGLSMYDEKYKQDFTEEELKNEVWKDVGQCKGYEEFAGLYEVSNLGRMRSLDHWVNHSSGNGRWLRKGKILKPNIGKLEYPYTALCLHGKATTVKMHRLVALAFLSNPNNYPIVNHKDEDKTNNRVDNLEWCTNKYNINYGTGIKRRAKTQGLRVKQYDKQGNLLHTYYSLKEAGRTFPNSHADNNIRNCCKGRHKTAYGYVWKYADKK